MFSDITSPVFHILELVFFLRVYAHIHCSTIPFFCLTNFHFYRRATSFLAPTITFILPRFLGYSHERLCRRISVFALLFERLVNFFFTLLPSESKNIHLSLCTRYTYCIQVPIQFSLKHRVLISFPLVDRLN